MAFKGCKDRKSNAGEQNNCCLQFSLHSSCICDKKQRFQKTMFRLQIVVIKKKLKP